MRTLPARLRVDFLLLLVAASWGSTYFVAKELVSDETVLPLLSVRMLLAAAVMALFARLRCKRMTRFEVFAGVPIGVLLAVVFTLETFGIAHTSATNAGLIISLTIVFTPILESLASRRRISASFLAAAAVAVAGTFALAGNGTFDPPTAGDLLVLGAAVVRAAHVVFMHKITGGKEADSLHLATVQLGTCAVLFTAGSFVQGDSVPQYLSRIGPGQVAMLLYLVLICTVFAFFVQIWAVRQTSPSRVSLMLGTEPIWVALLGVTIGHDSLNAAGYCGVALILAGTFWGRSAEQRHRSNGKAVKPPRARRAPGWAKSTPAVPLGNSFHTP